MTTRPTVGKLLAIMALLLFGGLCLSGIASFAVAALASPSRTVPAELDASRWMIDLQAVDEKYWEAHREGLGYSEVVLKRGRGGAWLGAHIQAGIPLRMFEGTYQVEPEKYSRTMLKTEPSRLNPLIPYGLRWAQAFGNAAIVGAALGVIIILVRRMRSGRG